MAKTAEMTVRIDGMHCAGCAQSIERGLAGLEGVAGCRVNLATRSAVVDYDARRADAMAIIGRINELGYGAAPGTPNLLTANEKEIIEARRSFLLALLLTIPLLIVSMSPTYLGTSLLPGFWHGVAQALLAGIVLLVGGRDILADALNQTRHLRANMNSLIAMGTLTAFCWSIVAVVIGLRSGRPEPLYFESVGMIITLILLGRYLEARARGRAGLAIQALVKLRPTRTTAIINGVEVMVDAAAVQPDMTILVKPGERIPADGEITQGRPVIDESVLTGESAPVEKSERNLVLGGSLNGHIPFTFRVTAAGEDSFLSHVIRMVAEAQSRKAPIQRLADRVAGVFVPIVIGLALLTLAIWLLFDHSSPMVIRSVIAVLIIACPCALGLATPTAILAGTGRAAREGVIIRGGDILERMARVDTVVFDKTGTLTTGRLRVSGIRVTGENLSENDLLKIVASAENRSEHPLAQAIVDYAREQGIELQPLDSVVTTPGFGLEAIWNDRRLVIGSKSLIDAEGIPTDAILSALQQELDTGHTVVLAALDGRVIGLIAVADTPRPEAKDVVAVLNRQMSMVTMLTGDNRRTAAEVARSVGLQAVEAEVHPDQKQVFVDSLRKTGHVVAMVGDGVNDAPALAAANVGIAVGDGTDVAVESGDVILARPDLTTLLQAFSVSRTALRVIKQNLFWAFCYNLLAIPLAAGLFYPAFGWTLSPTIAAAAMAFSSVFVVTNSLRLGRMDLD